MRRSTAKEFLSPLAAHSAGIQRFAGGAAGTLSHLLQNHRQLKVSAVIRDCRPSRRPVAGLEIISGGNDEQGASAGHLCDLYSCRRGEFPGADNCAF